jgi:hypothetical protein
MSDRERFIELMESFGIEWSAISNALELDDLHSMWYFDKDGRFAGARHV